MSDKVPYPWSDRWSENSLDALHSASSDWEIEQSSHDLLASAYDYAILDLIPKKHDTGDSSRQVALHIAFKALSSAFQSEGDKRLFVKHAVETLAQLNPGSQEGSIPLVQSKNEHYTIEEDRHLVLNSIAKYFAEDALQATLIPRDRQWLQGLSASMDRLLEENPEPSQPENIEDLVFELRRSSDVMVAQYKDVSKVARRSIENNLRIYREYMRNSGKDVDNLSRKIETLAKEGHGLEARILIEDQITDEEISDDLFLLLDSRIAYQACKMADKVNSAIDLEAIIDQTLSIAESQQPLMQVIHYRVIELTISKLRSGEPEEAKRCLDCVADAYCLADIATIIDNEVLAQARAIENDQGLALALNFVQKFASAERVSLMMHFLSEVRDGTR